MKSKTNHWTRALVMTLLVMLSTTSVQAEQVDETVLTVVTEVPTVDGGQTSNWGTNGSENYDKLVDGDLNTKYGLSNEDPYVEFHYEKAIVPKGYGLWTANDQSYRTPPAWTIKAKLNASDEWTTLVDRFYNRNYDKLPMTNNISATFTLDNTKSYKYFRFEAERCSSVSGKNFQLAELRFYVEREAGVLYESQVTLLQAIKSTGAQAFNTGYTHKANTRIEMDCEVTKNTQRDWEALFGARLHDFYSSAFCFFSRHHKNSAAVNGPCFNRSGVETVGYDFVYDQRIKLVCENKTATWYKYSSPNTVAGSVTTTGTADDGKTPMFLFNLNTADTAGGTTADTSPSVMTLYSCKIYEGSTLKCDFVPAKYNNVVGLYDRVRKTFSGSITSTAFEAVEFPAANIQADYDRALNAIEDGKEYRVFTRVDGVKYYVTADGKLSTDVDDAPLFTFTKVTPSSTEREYENGFQIKNGSYYFTNSSEEDGSSLKEGHICVTNRNSRTTWEAQVFFLNEEGKFAVRSTNAKSGTTSWSKVGTAFWTVDSSTSGPVAQYSWDMNYVWELEDELGGNYERALKTIKNEGSYRIFTMVGTQKYYITAGGELSNSKDDAPLFSFKKVEPKSADGDGEYGYGFQIINNNSYFTNSSEEDGSALKEGHICTTTYYKRTTWEAQVFFLNSEGKYAVRSTNSKSGDTGWALVGTAFWTVNSSTDGPVAEYSWDMNYVWELESGSGETEAYTGFATIDNIYYNLDGTTKEAEVTYKDENYNSYTGDVTVPGKVTYRGKEYTVTSIGESAFYKSSGLTSVTLPGTVTVISDWAFEDCSSLTTFTVPKTVTSIGDNPFLKCNGLTSLTVESGNPKYDSRGGCNAIIETETGTLVSACNTSVIPDGVKVLGCACFAYLNELSSIIIPNSVEKIGEYAFYYCTNLASVTFSENLKTIDYEAFYYCHSLTDLQLPEGVETIGDYAFCYCDNISTVFIPKSVKTIGEGAFYCCDNIIRVFSSMTDPCETDEYCFYYNPYVNATLYVPVGTKSKYEATNYWNQFQNIVEGEYREIAMADGRSLCYSLNKDDKTAEVTYEAYTDYAKYAYSGDVVIPEKVVFDGEEYTVTRIGNYAFGYCYDLTSVTIPNSVTSIGLRAFKQCGGLTSVTIPGSVTTIESFAFNGMDNLTSVTLPEGLTSIGNAVFGGDKLLTTITIPASVTSIGHFPFWGCDGLKTLQVASGNTKYDSRGGCNAIIETETNKLIQGCNVTVIPDDVVTIAQVAFYGFASLNTVVIPQSVTNIEMEAFRSSTGLTSVVIPSSVTSIGEYAFYDCANLVEVHSQVETPFEIAENVFSKSDGSFTTATLYVPVGTSEAYRDSNYWSKFTNIEEETYVITYPVWVGTTQVTDANKGDVLGDGTVTYEPGEGTGTLNFASGTTTINGMYNAAKIYADGINLTIDAPKGLFIENFVYGIYMSGANSELTVNGDLTFKTSQNPIYSSSRININGNLTAAEGYTGISAAYIAVNGNVNMKLSTNCISASEIVLNGTKHELSASSPCLNGTNITVTGDLTATSNNTPAISAKGDVTLVSGTWTLDGGNTRAIEWGNDANLNIPSTYAIIAPENAQIKSAGSGYNARKTVADAEGNEATHVVIGMMLDEEDAEAKNLNILAAQRGKEASFILKRTLKTGGWNTLASPVTFSDFTSVFGEGAKVKQLKSATLTAGVLNLKFEDATTIEAFTPYLVKVAAEVDLSKKVITGIVCDEPVIKETADLKFIPTMGTPHYQYTDDPKSVLFIGAGSKLYYADKLPLDIKGFRAFFVLNKPNAVRSVQMDLDDEGATLVYSERLNSGELADEWYTVDGRKLSKRPTAKGVYINHGKKTIVK